MIYVGIDSTYLSKNGHFLNPPSHTAYVVYEWSTSLSIFFATSYIYMIFFCLVRRYVLFTIDTIPLWFDYYLNEREFIKRQTTMHHAIFDWLKKVYSCVKSTWKVDVEFKSLVHNFKWLFNRFSFQILDLHKKRGKGLNSKRKQWIHTHFFW